MTESRYKNIMVSVIVPVYNVEKFLNRCITSIVNQTYRNLEILLIDDESPDNCPVLCDKWEEKDARIHVIHKKNQGLGMARNTGVDNAHGEYICFIDSDDYIELNTIEEAISVAVEKSAQVVVYGMIKENYTGKIITKQIPNKELLVFKGLAIKNKMIPAMVSADYYSDRIMAGLSCCEALISKNAINGAKWRIVSEKEIISEDVYSMLQLYATIDSVVIIPQAFYHYCQNDGSLTRAFRRDRFQRIIDFQKKAVLLSENCGYPQTVRMGIDSVCFSFIIGMLKTIVKSDLSKKEKIAEFKKILFDEKFQGILSNLDSKKQKPTWQILINLMRHKLLLTCYFLVYAKT